MVREVGGKRREGGGRGVAGSEMFGVSGLWCVAIATRSGELKANKKSTKQQCLPCEAVSFTMDD